MGARYPHNLILQGLPLWTRFAETCGDDYRGPDPLPAAFAHDSGDRFGGYGYDHQVQGLSDGAD